MGQVSPGGKLPGSAFWGGRCFLFTQVEGIESSVYSTPPDDQGGALVVSGGPCWDGEAENSLAPRPALTATPTFGVPRAAGHAARGHGKGTFRAVEGRDAAVAVRSRDGQAL